MGFVHQPKDNPWFILILCRHLAPDVCEFVVRRAPLTDDVRRAFPTGVIMDIDDAVTPRLETSLNQVIVQSKGINVQLCSEGVGQKELPRYREPKNVQTIRLGKMLHLADSVGIILVLGDVRQIPLPR